jgi:hypothetical protein
MLLQRLATATRNMACAKAGSKKARVRGERTKYQELLWQITMANKIGNVADVVRGKVEEKLKSVLP